MKVQYFSFNFRYDVVPKKGSGCQKREITGYPRNAKIARPSLSLCLCTFFPVFKQIIFLSHKAYYSANI